MTKRQNAKLNMAQQVSNVFETYKDVFAGINPMVESVTELKTTISDIRETEKNRGSIVIPAVTLTKREAEDRMVSLSLQFSNSLYVIGFSTSDNELMALASISARSFYNVTDNLSLVQARRIQELSLKNADALKAYKLDEAKLSEFLQAIDTFEELVTSPSDSIATRKEKRKSLNQLFAELDSILYDKCDRIMVLFKESDPEFYGKYRTARNIK
mgnify:CR=1 FL=1